MTSGDDDEHTGTHGVDRGGNESSHGDAIGAAIASAMLAWCNERDRKAMRRMLLELLLELDEK